MTPSSENQVRPIERMSLYALTGDLIELLAAQAEMIENGEDVTAITQQIVAYIGERIPERVDSCAHVSRMLQAQEELAEKEEKRLRARKHFFHDARERLHQYLERVLGLLPEPKRGTRKLEGHTATLSLRTNSGLQALEYQEDLLPAEFFNYQITLSHREHLQAIELLGTPAVKNAERIVDTDLIRQHLALPCQACQGGKFSRADMPCGQCGGDGMQHIPGARLRDRGHHVRVL